MRLIDSHLHFWDQRGPDPTYPWLQAGALHPILGDIDSMKAPLYDPAAYIAETRFCGVEKAVHVEADARSNSPFTEPSWVRAVAAEAGLPTAIVMKLDLAAPVAPENIASLRAWEDIRAVRDFGVVGYLSEPGGHPGFEASLVALEDAGLVLDLDCSWEGMTLAREMARSHPGLPIVLEHIGYPRSRDDAYFSEWAPAIHHLGQAENVFCKLSGLGMTDTRWTVESLSRWVETSLEAFSPGRCMFGSNWPVDRIASSFDSLVSSFYQLISSCTSDEQETICWRNAEQLYFAPVGTGR